MLRKNDTLNRLYYLQFTVERELKVSGGFWFNSLVNDDNHYTVSFPPRTRNFINLFIQELFDQIRQVQIDSFLMGHRLKDCISGLINFHVV